MTSTPTTDGLQPLTASTYVALADFLSDQGDAAWDTPSLCTEWRVRELVAHVTMPARYGQEEFLAELEAHGFDFDRLSNAIAARDGELPTPPSSPISARRPSTSWLPPGGGEHGALNHAVIHALDATVPLDAAEVVPAPAVAVVLDDLTVGGVSANFGTRLDGRRLEATDRDWAHGTGDPLRGPAHLLALAVCGRTVPQGGLEGAPIDRQA